MPDIVPLDEARRRLRVDHDLLLSTVEGCSDDELRAPYASTAGPLGDFCESLHDLVAHVLMWDEISLEVLREADAGREHWSLDPRWETPEAGRLLNRAGVAAARHLPGELLLHRSVAVWDAVLAEFAALDEAAWTGPGRPPQLADGYGTLAQRVWTVPGRPAFWHAAIHLDQLARLTDAEGRTA